MLAQWSYEYWFYALVATFAVSLQLYRGDYSRRWFWATVWMPFACWVAYEMAMPADMNIRIDLFFIPILVVTPAILGTVRAIRERWRRGREA